MIVIEHGLNYIRCYSWRGYEFKPTGKLRNYTIGLEPPNYPVPATWLDNLLVDHVQNALFGLDKKYD